jgi:hypothetical protein
MLAGPRVHPMAQPFGDDDVAKSWEVSFESAIDLTAVPTFSD